MHPLYKLKGESLFFKQKVVKVYASGVQIEGESVISFNKK